jgi:hypothetical protein
VLIDLQNVEERFAKNTLKESAVGHYKLDPEHGRGKEESEEDVITF